VGYLYEIVVESSYILHLNFYFKRVLEF